MNIRQGNEPTSQAGQHDGRQDSYPSGGLAGDVLETLGQRGLLAVLRGTDPAGVTDAALTLIDAGIDVLEITFTVPDCARIIHAVKHARPDATVGAGTVTTAERLHEALQAGAEFIVTPGTTAPLLTELAACGRPFLPGVLTPSDVMAAVAAGAPGVKLFPGSMTGPTGITALHGPFPDLRVVPTGGVRPSNVADWFAAGAHAVGAGTDLAPITAVDTTDHALLRSRARQWLNAVEEARASRPISH